MLRRGRPPSRFRALDRPDGSSVAAELAVVVVLDDQSTGAPSPAEQVATSVRRKGLAGGVLVGGADHDGRRLGIRFGAQPVRAHPLVIDVEGTTRAPARARTSRW